MGDETINQKKEVVQGAKALGSLGQKYVKGTRERLLAPVAHLTTVGKYVAGAAALVAVLCAGLIVFDASNVDVETDNIAVVDTQKANIRKSPTTKAKVLTQAQSGDRFEIVESGEKWTNIRSADGKLSGWIATSLLRTNTGRTFVYRYDMKGYILILLAAVIAFIVALRFGRTEGGKGESGRWKVER